MRQVMRRGGWTAAALGWGLLACPAAWAGNGHFLHGVGAVNSSLGGVSTSEAFEVIGVLNDNPALLTEFEDYQVAFGAEVFKDGPKATAAFSGAPFGPGSFTTKGKTEPGVLPAFGVVYHPRGARWAAGFGLLAVAGFRTDWPQDSTNPIFTPQPNGFGAVKTDLAIVKIPFGLAYQATPRLALGVNLNLYKGGLAISPLPPAPPGCTGATPGSGRAVDCFYAPGENVVSSYALAGQVGLHYRLTGGWSAGLSYTSPQHFPRYVWNSFDPLPYTQAGGVKTPNPHFGTAQKISWKLDGPQIVSAGLGWTVSPQTRIGLDVRWVGYSSDAGAGGPGGFKPDRSLNDIGWRDIWVGAVGVEHRATPKLTLRAGFNYSQSPIRSQVAFTSLGTPPTFTDHYCLGLGYDLTPHLQANVGAYYAPRHSVSGPLLSAFLVPSPQGLSDEIVPGGTFTISEQIVSASVSLSFRF